MLKLDKGDSFAQYWMGFLASTVDKNAEMAIYWYERSARQGNIDAMRDLSFGYSEFLNTSNLGYEAIGLGYDDEKELYWLKKPLMLEMPSLLSN